ncbi:MAG: AbrB/MazE/SpoVT family DNA-binding domain-containing protein [Moorellaceae bacterium]
MITRLSSKGQIVLPKNIREQLALKEGAELKVEVIKGKIVLEPVVDKMEPGWRRWKGILKGSKVLEEHLAEHAIEVEQE